MRNAIPKSQTEIDLAMIALQAAASAKSLPDRARGLNDFLMAIKSPLRVAMSYGWRNLFFENEPGNRVTVKAGLATMAKGSIMAAPNSCDLTGAAAKAVEAEVVAAVQDGLKGLVLSYSIARTVVTVILSGLWAELDLDKEEGRQVALAGRAARQLPAPLRPRFGQWFAATANEQGWSVAKRLRQDLLNCPAAIRLLDAPPLEGGNTPAERLTAAGLPVELAALHKGIVGSGPLNKVTAPLIAEIIRIGKAGNRWPRTLSEQRRALALLLPALLMPEPAEGFFRWLILGVLNDLGNALPDAGVRLTLWASARAGNWRPAGGFDVAQADAARLFAQLGRQGRKAVAAGADLMAPFPVSREPALAEAQRLWVVPARNWGDLVDAGRELSCCIGGKPYRDVCLREGYLVVTLREAVVEGKGEGAKLVQGKAVAAALLRGAEVIEFRAFANSEPKLGHRRALDLFIAQGE